MCKHRLHSQCNIKSTEIELNDDFIVKKKIYVRFQFVGVWSDCSNVLTISNVLFLIFSNIRYQFKKLVSGMKQFIFVEP